MATRCLVLSRVLRLCRRYYSSTRRATTGLRVARTLKRTSELAVDVPVRRPAIPPRTHIPFHTTNNIHCSLPSHQLPCLVRFPGHGLTPAGTPPPPPHLPPATCVAFVYSCALPSLFPHIPCTFSPVPPPSTRHASHCTHGTTTYMPWWDIFFFFVGALGLPWIL